MKDAWRPSRLAKTGGARGGCHGRPHTTVACARIHQRQDRRPRSRDRGQLSRRVRERSMAKSIDTQPARAPKRRYAARAFGVAPSTTGHDTPGMIMFASGEAYPESLPDMSEFARRAAFTHRTETLQYAPR